MVRLALLVMALAVAGCISAWQPPGSYYENDIHHGYPGPGVTDPSAQ